MAQSLGFSREQTPCVATLHHVFRRLDVDAFETALGRWAQEFLGAGEAVIALDGKALAGDTRRGVARGAAGGGIRWGERPGTRTKGGIRGDRKESELGLASGLLAQLELKVKVVTGDALYA